MTTAAPTLADFILARVAEDEAKARFVDRGIVDGIEEFHEILGWRDALVIDASRVLAQCAATRAVVELADSMNSRHCDLTLRHLASVYVDHPDFRDDWRP